MNDFNLITLNELIEIQDAQDGTGNRVSAINRLLKKKGLIRVCQLEEDGTPHHVDFKWPLHSPTHDLLCFTRKR